MGYIIKGKEDKVLKLKKTLYGLKQAPQLGTVNLTSIYNAGISRNDLMNMLSMPRQVKIDIYF